MGSWRILPAPPRHFPVRGIAPRQMIWTTSFSLQNTIIVAYQLNLTDTIMLDSICIFFYKESINVTFYTGKALIWENSQKETVNWLKKVNTTGKQFLLQFRNNNSEWISHDSISHHFHNSDTTTLSLNTTACPTISAVIFPLLFLILQHDGLPLAAFLHAQQKAGEITCLLHISLVSVGAEGTQGENVF